VQPNTVRIETGVIAAGARTANLLLGKLIQYPGRPSIIRVTGTVPAAAAGDGLMQLTIGGRVVTDIGLRIPTELAAGRGPDSQLGWLYEGPAMGNELLELIVVNSDTVNAIAAPGATLLVQLQPVA
jgi:hypothetical protein